MQLHESHGRSLIPFTHYLLCAVNRWLHGSRHLKQTQQQCYISNISNNFVKLSTNYYSEFKS